MSTAAATPNKKKTSLEQLNYMVDFISNHKILLHGKTKPSEANNNIIEKLWDELSISLNAMGCGPTKSKAQWKKTFIDWKSHTKKRARECLKSEQKTGGGEPDSKKLTPLEENLMALLSWITVRGVDVNEVGFEEESEKSEEIFLDVPIEIGLTEAAPMYEKSDEVDGIEPLASISVKRSAEPIHSQAKRKIQVKEKSSNLQKAAEAYAAGQKETTEILKKVLCLKDMSSSPENIRLRERELDIKEYELKVRFLEAKNKSQELVLKERELRIREKELGMDGY